MSERQELSARYYIAESSVWIVGGVLLLAQFVGLAPNQSVPILGIDLEDGQQFPRVCAVLLVLAFAYEILEWKQSSSSARRSVGSRVRLGMSAMWGLGALWASYPILAKGTPVENLSRAWYLVFGVLGLFMGASVSAIVIGLLGIRSRADAERLHLPRVPAASRAQFVANGPLLLALVVGSFVLLPFVGEGGRAIVVVLAIACLVATLLDLMMTLLLCVDAQGTRIPFSQRVNQLRGVFDSHDYSYALADFAQGSSVPRTEFLGKSAQQIQDRIRQRFSVKASESVRFRVRIEEELAIEFAPPHGAAGNQSAPASVSVRKTRGAGDAVRVTVLPADAAFKSRTMEVPLAIITELIQQQLSDGTSRTGIDPSLMLSDAVNTAVTHVMAAASKEPLHEAATLGLDELVRFLIDDGVEINQRATGGWTPLMIAVAQGHLSTARTLLEAGADPDIGNVHGITPLAYSARYDHLPLCELLLEYGASVNVRDIYGETPLMVAARGGNTDLTSILLNAGADVSFQNNDNETALSLAQKNRHGSTAKLLRHAAARNQRA